MTIEQAREIYRAFSDKASGRIRELAYGALAVIWLLDGNKGLASSINSLGTPLGLAVGALTLDLLQYLYGTAVWGLWSRKKEKEKKKRADAVNLTVPAIMNWPTLIFFWGKAFLILGAYAAMFVIIARRLL